MLSWLRENLGTLFLALILAITAWVAAVSQEDPIIEQVFESALEIEYQGLQDGLTIVGEVPETGQITLRAPSSVWLLLSQDDLRLTVDLSNVEAGNHRLQIEPVINSRATQMTALEPSMVELEIELLATKIIDIDVALEGNPGADYRAEEPIVAIDRTTIIGPTTIVDRVVKALVRIDLNSRQQSIDQEFTLIPVDEAGDPVTGIALEHENVQITLAITRIENIRRLVVIPNVTGQDLLEQQGYYRVTSISVTPPEVAIFSDDAEALEALPGFLETIPIEIEDRTTSVDQRVPLDIPEGFSLIGEQSVRVEVSIAPITTTVSLTRPVEIQSVRLGLYSYVSPEEVDLILTGPAIILDELQPEQVRVIIDVLNLDQGTYQLEPEVIVLPDDVTWEPPNPALIEVTLTYTPRPTATFTP
jgi:YbbR domain-containing protein